jgi:tRNA pseudouridine38-40 synthase
MRYFFHIGYNGFNYHGWQRHAGFATIQETLEDNLSKLLKVPVTIVGCGRTDAQVHASQYFFHLNSETELNQEIIFRLNKMLPEDIAVFDIIKVDDDAHAQYSPVKRTYDYFIHTYKDPFLNRFSSYYQGKPLDTEKIKQALALLPKYNDYYAFCKSPEKQEHTICQVTSAEIFSNSKGDKPRRTLDPVQGGKLRIQISSNRFLRGMIRAIVAKLLKVGSGEINIAEFENYLIEKEFKSDIEFAHPQGLYLSRVVYPFLDIPARTDFSPFNRHSEEKEWQLVP